LTGARQVGRGFQGSGGRTHHGEETGSRRADFRGGLEFQEDNAVPAMGDHIDFATARGQPDRAEVGRLIARSDTCRSRQGFEAGTQQIADLPTQWGAFKAQQTVRVSGDLQDLLRHGVNDKQDAVRLDGARDVDRLLVASGQID
jgi:hypothetical protein